MRSLLAGIAALPFLMIQPSRSNAQVVTVCPTCASIAEQLISDAKQAQQYLTQTASLRTELNSYAQLVTSGVTLPQSIWANVQGDIMQIRSIANAASLLTGNAGGIVNRLNSANGYLNQASSLPSNVGAQFSMYQTTLGNANLQLGRTLGVQQGQEQNATALQVAIQSHSQTAAGQMQAIQAGNEMAGLTNYNLQQIHTTMIAAAEEVAIRDTIAAERDAIADAYTVQFFAPPDLPLTGPRYR